MPSQVHYLNPSSFAPQNEYKFSGPMGGAVAYDQLLDYRKLMEVEHTLQQLGMQRAQQEQSEFMEGAPLRAQERQLKGEVIGGQLPHAREVAGQEMLTKGAEAQFKRETDYSPEKKQSFFADLKKKTDDNQWKQWERELSVGATLANQAMKIAQQGGEAQAIGWMQQQIGKLKQAGVNLPEQHFMDPKRWGGIYQSAVESVEHMRKVNEEAVKGNFDLEQERIRQRGNAETARTRASAASNTKEPTPAQRKATLRRLISSRQLSGEDLDIAKEELRGYVMDDFNKLANSDPMLKALAGTASLPQLDPTGQAAKKYQTEYQRKLNDYLKRYGLETESLSSPNGNDGEVRQAVEAAGQKYEPNKYDYKIENGRILRKPK